MPQATLRQIIRYRFDSFMARGGSSIFVSLVVVFLGILILVALLRGLVMLLYPSGAEHIEGGFFGHIYIAFLELTDPGNMNQDIQSSVPFKAPGIIAGLAGVIILSMLIAFITTALDQKLAQLKKGHSKVIEEDHTLILGWSDRAIEILRELILANESEDDPCVVILAEKDKEEMDDLLGVNLPDPKNTRIVTRSGSVSSLVNLDIVSVQSCKSVIVLGSCTDGDTDEAKMASDSRVIKTILGLIAAKAPDQQLNVVAVVFHARNRRIAEDISPDEVTTIDAIDILAKIIVQTSRSVGLSVVYAEIMSFDGCEMYFYEGEWPQTPFGELPFHFPDGVPLGIRRANGELLVNPPLDTMVVPGDEALILADDDSTIEYRPEPVAVPADLALAGGRVEHATERQLVVGWNPKAPIILREYADYVLDGSSVDLLVAEPEDHVRAQIAELQERLPNLRVNLVASDPLRSESYADLRASTYHNVLILSQGGVNADPETVDSGTIIILLLLRRLLGGAAGAKGQPSLISEVMDSRNQELVAHAGVHDFIISNRLISKLLAQISEQRDIKRVYDDLFEEDGSEIYLKPASLYFESFPMELTFADMMRIAQKREEICLGVKIKADEQDLDRNFGVKLIPEKTTRYTLQADDCLVVLAEDDT